MVYFNKEIVVVTPKESFNPMDEEAPKIVSMDPTEIPLFKEMIDKTEGVRPPIKDPRANAPTKTDNTLEWETDGFGSFRPKGSKEKFPSDS